jgi:hypothetical protein
VLGPIVVIQIGAHTRSICNALNVLQNGLFAELCAEATGCSMRTTIFACWFISKGVTESVTLKKE